MKNFALLALFLVCLPLQLLAEPIKIGAVLALTGDGASWGQNAQRGIQLAVEEVNAAGGVNGQSIEVVVEDSPGAKGLSALTAYRKLVSVNKIKILIGFVTQDEFNAVAPLLSKDDVFVVTLATENGSPENAVSVWVDPEIEGQALAQNLSAKYKTLGILSSQSSWEMLVAKVVKEAFERAGGKVVVFEEPAAGLPDGKLEALKIKRFNPEAVYISSYSNFPQYMKAIRDLKLTLPIYGIELDQAAIDLAEGSAEGVVFIKPQLAPADFEEKFHKRFEIDSDMPAAQFYDGVNLLIAAMKKFGAQTQALQRFFKTLKEYKGVSGTISFQEGKTILPLEYFVVRSGKMERQVFSK